MNESNIGNIDTVTLTSHALTQLANKASASKLSKCSETEVDAAVAPFSTKIDSSIGAKISVASATKQKTNSDAIVASSSSNEIPSLEELKHFNYSQIRIRFDKGPIGFSSEEEYHKNILEDYGPDFPRLLRDLLLFISDVFES